MIVFIAMGVFFSEIWARQETKKSFNWVALMDEAIVGILAVTTIHWLDVIQQQQAVWTTPWAAIAAVVTGVILAGAVLERLRPFCPYPHIVRAEDAGDLAEAVADNIRNRQAWAYLETQNPLYVSIISLVLAVGMTALFLPLLWDTVSWLTVIPIVSSVSIGVLLYGGLRVQAARRQLVVCLGIMGLRLLRIPFDEIASAEVQTFNPLREFGGWGLRFGRPQWALSGGKRRGVWAFYFRGTQGVKVVRNDGRIYLIGSDHPERLCVVIRTAASMTSQNG